MAITRNEKLAVLVIALIAWLGHGLMLQAPLVIGEPWVVAEHLVTGKGFASIYPFAPQDQIHNYIPPLYAYLLAGCIKLGLGIRAIQWIELGMLAAACFPLYATFRRYVGQFGALLGLGVFALYIPLWRMAACIDPNALNVLLLATTIYFMVSFDKTKQSIWKLGLVIAVQLIVRPDILFFVPLLLIWLKRYRDARVMKLAVPCLVAAFVITLPFAIRNFVAFGEYLPLSSNGGYNLFIGNNRDANGEYMQLAALNDKQYVTLHDEASIRTQPSFDRYLMMEAISWIGDHPVDWAELFAKKIYYHWWRRASAVREDMSHLIVLYDSATIMLYLLSLFAIWRMKSRELRMMIFSICLYSTLVSAIFFVQTRHRMLKVDPLLVMLSGGAIAMMYESSRRRRSKGIALENVVTSQEA